MQTRRSFLARLLGLGAGMALPRAAPAPARRVAVEYRIRAFHVAGFQYHAGPRRIRGMRVGDTLALISEPENAYDPHAIRIEWRGAKLGYVPRRQNRELHALLTGGAPLGARIEQVNADAEPWEAVAVAVLLRG